MLSFRKGLLALGLIGALAGCTTAQQEVACNVDGKLQPLAASLLATLLPASTPAVDVDTGIVHPAIVKYCASLGATDAVVVTPTASPAAPTITSSAPTATP